MENPESALAITIQRGERQLGPFTEEEVRSGLRSGMFAPSDLWWRAGMEAWEPLSAFPASSAVPSKKLCRQCGCEISLVTALSVIWFAVLHFARKAAVVIFAFASALGRTLLNTVRKTVAPPKILCRQCSSELPAASVFCGQCGERNAPPDAVPSENFCRQCGAQLAPMAVICTQCGTSTSQSKAKMPKGRLAFILACVCLVLLGLVAFFTVGIPEGIGDRISGIFEKKTSNPAEPRTTSANAEVEEILTQVERYYSIVEEGESEMKTLLQKMIAEQFQESGFSGGSEVEKKIASKQILLMLEMAEQSLPDLDKEDLATEEGMEMALAKKMLQLTKLEHLGASEKEKNTAFKELYKEARTMAKEFQEAHFLQWIEQQGLDAKEKEAELKEFRKMYKLGGASTKKKAAAMEKLRQRLERLAEKIKTN